MNFSMALRWKQAIGQLFVEDVYIFPISFRNVIVESQIFFFLLYDIERSFITFLKICSQKHGYWIWLAYIKYSNFILISWCIIFIFMVITFRTMYNKNQFFYNTRGNYKNINLNILLAKKYKKDLLTYNKSEQKIIMNL